MGDSLKILIISQQKTVHGELVALTGLPDKSRVAHFVHTSSGYMNRNAFILYLDHCFLPGLTEIREREKLHGRKAILIMDGFDGHKGPEIQERLDKALVEIVWLLPHSTHITQPLDLVTFATFKRNHKRARADYIENKQARRLYLGLDALSAACTNLKNRRAFGAGPFSESTR